MSQGANVRSLDALRDFKVTLINFAEEAGNALTGVEMEIRQVRNWLQRDQLTYWQAQVKRGQERVSIARTELHRRQLMQSNSDAISDTEQKEALREAQRKLREAEEKVITIKKWIPVIEHAISEYHCQAQPLGDRLAGSFVATLSLMDRMLAALDSYLATAAPTTRPIPRPRPAREEAESTAEGSSGPGADAGAVEAAADGAPGPGGRKDEPAAGPASSPEAETQEYPTTSDGGGRSDSDATAEFSVEPR
jgi:hypothetical protein